MDKNQWGEFRPNTKDKPGTGMPILPSIGKRVPQGAFNTLIAKFANLRGVPVDLALRQAEQESGFHPDIVAGRKKSSAGASGLYQFMPATAKNVGPKVGYTDKEVMTKPEPAAAAGMWYMQYLYKKFGNWKHAVWAYNWGEGNVWSLVTGKPITIRGKKVIRTSLPEETRLYGLIVADGLTKEQARALPKSAI